MTPRLPAAVSLPRRRFVAALGSAMVGLARAHELPPAAAHGFELPRPKPLEPFELLDHRGRRFGPSEVQGRWTLLLFGYTHCTDVCPTTLVDVREARRLLAQARGDVDTSAVFVSVDPEHDTQQRMAEYVANFGDGLIGVRGSPPAVKAFAEQFRVRYAAVRKPGQPAAIDHTASVALLGPDGALHAVFMLPLRPAQVAADIARLHQRRQAAHGTGIERTRERGGTT